MKGIWDRKDKGFIVRLRAVSPDCPPYKLVKTTHEAFAALSEASQQPTDMYETIDAEHSAAEHSAEHNAEPSGHTFGAC